MSPRLGGPARGEKESTRITGREVADELPNLKHQKDQKASPLTGGPITGTHRWSLGLNRDLCYPPQIRSRNNRMLNLKSEPGWCVGGDEREQKELSKRPAVPWYEGTFVQSDRISESCAAVSAICTFVRRYEGPS
jgi:hypothetical protein